METTTQDFPKTLDRSPIPDTDFYLMLANAGKYLGNSSKKQESALDGEMLLNALKYLEAGKYRKQREKPRRSGFVKAAIAAGTIGMGVASLAASPIGTELGAFALENKRIEAPDVRYDPNKIFVAESTPVPTETPTPEPTVDPKILAQKEVGERNVAEYFLGNLVDQFVVRRQEKAKTDPEFAKRIQKEFLNAKQINMLYLGLDSTRERDFNSQGLGRSDVIMLISFDPHSFKTTTISIPRDLYAPEVAKYFPGVPKINSMTMVNAISQGRNVDANELARRTVEDATGIPIDMVVKTNIDFMQGFPEHPGIFDSLFPDGLKINVPKDIDDPEFPVFYETEHLLFKKGEQVMQGKRLTDYARTRHADSDYGRSERQRQILQASLRILFPEILDDLIKGDTKTIDKIVKSLEEQKTSSNLFYDTDLIEIIKTARNSLATLRDSPKGLAIMGVLGLNSKDIVSNFLGDREKLFVSFGLTSANGLSGISPEEGFEGISMLKVAGANLNSSPLTYWSSVRRQIYDLYRK